MKPFIGLVAALGVLLVQGCTAPSAGGGGLVIFKKPDRVASSSELRRDWGLCGGLFMDDGRLRYRGRDDPVTRCMIGKGWVTEASQTGEVWTYWYNARTKQLAGMGQHLSCGAEPNGQNVQIPALKAEAYEKCMKRAGYKEVVSRR